MVVLHLFSIVWNVTTSSHLLGCTLVSAIETSLLLCREAAPNTFIMVVSPDFILAVSMATYSNCEFMGP